MIFCIENNVVANPARKAGHKAEILLQTIPSFLFVEHTFGALPTKSVILMIQSSFLQYHNPTNNHDV